MTKTLLIIVILLILVYRVRKLLESGREILERGRTQATGVPSPRDGGSLVACEQCGDTVPASRTVPRGGEILCARCAGAERPR